MNILNDPLVNRGLVYLILVVFGGVGATVLRLVSTYILRGLGAWGDRNRQVGWQKYKDKQQRELDQYEILSRKYQVSPSVATLSETVDNAHSSRQIVAGSWVKCKKGVVNGGQLGVNIHGRKAKEGDCFEVTEVKRTCLELRIKDNCTQTGHIDEFELV